MFKVGDRIRIVNANPKYIDVFIAEKDKKLFGTEWTIQKQGKGFTTSLDDGSMESGHFCWNLINNKGDTILLGDLIFELVSNKSSRLDCSCLTQELMICGCKCGAFKQENEDI